MILLCNAAKLFSSPAARHGDGLYDSYMRTDHILKDDADTNSPSGLPPVPKHTVSIQWNTPVVTHSQFCQRRALHVQVHVKLSSLSIRITEPLVKDNFHIYLLKAAPNNKMLLNCYCGISH